MQSQENRAFPGLRSLIDFGLVFGQVDAAKYEYLRFPTPDSYGILMRKDSPLAEKEAISPEDLWDRPLMFNRNTRDGDILTTWLRKRRSFSLMALEQ